MWQSDKQESNGLCCLGAQLNALRREKGPNRAFPPTGFTHALSLEP